MKLAIMQPYLFPYIGYFQLINSVDKFIFYNDVNYIKQGWINRNQILMNSNPSMFTVPLKNASSNNLIKDVFISEQNYTRWKDKFYKSLMSSYSKAPNYEEILVVIKSVLDKSSTLSISELAINSIEAILNYLKINKDLSSSQQFDNAELRASKRVLDICKKIGATTYINAIGGLNLYSKEEFQKEGINLFFLKTNDITYPQFNHIFVPNLSIIDILMFNSIEETHKLIKEYTLI